ncbi:MAG: S24/S26 family peptidase [Oscillospiraceae bacterium]|nr:S24/S26 family peptidase [Oscillospiraceae bacterium]
MSSSPERVILGDELMELVRSQLAAGQKVRYLPFRGVSMMPMLRQGKDAVEIAPLPKKLKKYDLPVYQYPSGKYVMHRIVGVKADHYICLGDNTYEYEKVAQEQMIGIVSAFQRGDRRISVDAPMYRFYCRVWWGLFPLRKFLKRIKRWLRRHLKCKNHP